ETCMTDSFSDIFFAGNRERLQSDTRAQLIVLSAHGVLQRSADTTFPFRQDSNFWYLTGIEEPDFLLVMTPDLTFLIAPRRDDHRDQGDGAIDKQQLRERSGIDMLYEHHEGWTKL